MSERTAEIHRRQLLDVAALSAEAVETLLETLSEHPLSEWARLLRELLPEIVETYGSVAGELALNYYNARRRELMERERAEARRKKKKLKQVEPFEATAAIIPAAAILEKFNDRVNGLIGSTFNNIAEGAEGIDPEDAPKTFADFPEDYQKKISTELQELVKRDAMNHSRETIAIAADKDPAPVIAIRSVNATGCEWCRLLWHRGYIATKFHPGCGCLVDVDIKGKVVKPAWADEWEKQYRSVSGSSKASNIVVQMRKQNQEAAVLASE